MKRIVILSLLVVLGLALEGCAAGIAMSAVSMGVQLTQNQARFEPTAAKACTREASRYGGVNILGIERRTPRKTIVRGTVKGGKGLQSFDCSFDAKIRSFRLGRLRPN